ncbi:MAG: hypothetical protein ACYTKD_30175, partial [Planctomycetota bacterium]
MAAHYSQKELADIVRLKDIEGKTHKEIAIILGRTNKAGEPNARAVMQQYKKAKANGVLSEVKAAIADTKLAPPSLMEDEPKALPVQESPKETLSGPGGPPPIEEVAQPEQLNELSKRQRVIYLRQQFEGGNASARNRHTFQHILQADEQEIFLEEYFTIVREEDSITAAEEQQLFNAILHLVLALRAKARDESCYQKSPAAGYTGVDAAPYIDVHTREYHEQMKKYKEAMKGLNLSREQRVKNLQRHGTTFLDFAEKYSKTDEQARAADEIMKLEEMSQVELVKLQANGWLIA